MSIKRQATTELNHDNWDQEDPSDHDEMGQFKTAPKDVLEKRVIRTARRRTAASSDGVSKSVFSGFGGFNKTQPKSFEFLGNLINVSQASNGSTTNEPPATSSLFSNKPPPASGSLFSGLSSTAPTKPSFGSVASGPSSSSLLFATQSSTTKSPLTSLSAAKQDSTVKESPFKLLATSSPSNTNKPAVPLSTSKLFSTSSTANDIKQLFSANIKSTPPTVPAVSSVASAPTFSSTPMKTSTSSKEPQETVDDTNNDKKMKYYARLKGLNESVTDWIRKHVEKGPLCILTPVFQDYERYLKEIQDEYHGSESKDKNNCLESEKTNLSEKPSVSVQFNAGSLLQTPTTHVDKPNTFNNYPSNDASIKAPSAGIPFNKTSNSVDNKLPSTASSFGNTNNDASAETSAGFSFVEASKDADAKTTNTNFSFAKTNNNADSKVPSANFSFGKTTSADTKTPNTSFSFGKANNEPETKIPSSGFSFGKTNKEADTKTANTSFTFAKSNNADAKSPNTSFSFSKTNNEADNKTNTSFSFGKSNNDAENKVTNTSFSFGKTTSGNDADAVKANSTFSFSKTNNDAEPKTTNTSFSFGKTTTDAETKTSSPGFSFGNKANDVGTKTPTSGFSFGIANNDAAKSPSTGFSFGKLANDAIAKSANSGFSFASSPPSGNQSGSGFSFGLGKPFSFSPGNVQQKSDTTEADKEADDEPPKVEYTPIVEENSVYEKKCKIFVKKDKDFVDSGVGTLYVKKIEESGKHQLLVRANTSLGNVLLNLILSSGIPTQRMGKNNVMLVCIPTPEAKPPPTPVLIRVKTSDEADELLETLNKYKS